jgi:hypothetical protein
MHGNSSKTFVRRVYGEQVVRAIDIYGCIKQTEQEWMIPTPFELPIFQLRQERAHIGIVMNGKQ